MRTLSKKTINLFIAALLVVNTVNPGSIKSAHAQSLSAGMLTLPAPGTMVPISQAYNPAIMKGIKIHPQNPLQFDFIVDIGDDNLEGNALKEESVKLIKYFLTALTVPEEKMWVNLSPYEKDRIIPDSLRETEMGRDLLAQDYVLKQLMASMMYPEEEVGKIFWERVHQKIYEKFGTEEIPMNTFNKIWIVPEDATVHVYGESAFVLEHHLKVMLDKDYFALKHNARHAQPGLRNVEKQDMVGVEEVSSEIIREVLIPEIEQEVNTGKNFSQLRQIFNSVILATWYKKNLQESFLGKAYVDKDKTVGLEVEDRDIYQKIYDQYVEAFKQGVYDYIKEDYSVQTQEVIPRKYFSGGVEAAVHVTAEVKNISSGIPVIPQRTKILPTMIKVRQEDSSAEKDGSLTDDSFKSEGDEAMLVQTAGQKKVQEKIKKKIAVAIMAYKNGDKNWQRQFREINEREEYLSATPAKVISFTVGTNHNVKIQYLMKNEDYRVELKDVKDIGLVMYLTNDTEQVGVFINLGKIKEGKRTIPSFSSKGKTREEINQLLKKEVFKRSLGDAIMAYTNKDKDWQEQFREINEREEEYLSATPSAVISFTVETKNSVRIQHLIKNGNYRVELKDIKDIGLVMYLTNNEEQVGVVINLEDIKKKKRQILCKGKTREEINRLLKQEVFKRSLGDAIMAYTNGDNDWRQKFVAINEQKQALTASSGGRILFSLQKNNEVQIQYLIENKDYQVELSDVEDVGLVIYLNNDGKEVGIAIALDEVKEWQGKKVLPSFIARGDEGDRELINHDLAFKKKGWKLIRAKESKWQPLQFVIDNLESAEQSSDKVVTGNEVKKLLSDVYTDKQIDLILQATELIYDDLSVEKIFQELGLDKDARAWFEDQWNNHLPTLLNGFRDTDKESQPGGIDMNPRHINLTVQGDEVDFHFDIDPENQNFNIIGLTPVIIDILPMTQVTLFGKTARAKERQRF